MKKSNIIIVIAIMFSFCWTILIGWFAATAINNYPTGKNSCFARTHRQYLESRKQTFPNPSGELYITGEGDAILTIVPGKELTVLSIPSLWTCGYTQVKNGRSVLTLRKLSEYNDPVTIIIPEISSLTLDNFSKVTIRGLNRNEFHIQCTRVSSFISDSCSVKTLFLDFPRSRDLQDVFITQSNHIENFNANVMGSGKLRMETSGVNNEINLSDSVKVEAPYDLLKKLATEPISRSSKK